MGVGEISALSSSNSMKSKDEKQDNNQGQNNSILLTTPVSGANVIK